MLRDFLSFRDNSGNLDQTISRLSFDISRTCSKDRTLLSPNPDPFERKKVISKRQYVDGVPAYKVCASSSSEQAPIESGRGHEILQKLGWSGETLGRDSSGIAEPLQLKGNVNVRGLGFEDSSFISKTGRSNLPFVAASTSYSVRSYSTNLNLMLVLIFIFYNCFLSHSIPYIL